MDSEPAIHVKNSILLLFASVKNQVQNKQELNKPAPLLNCCKDWFEIKN